MDSGHPLGPEFSRWVELTDAYASSLAATHLGEEVDAAAVDTFMAELTQVGEAKQLRAH